MNKIGKARNKTFLSILTSGIAISSVLSVSILLLNNKPKITQNELNKTSTLTHKVTNNTISRDFHSFDKKIKFKLWNTNQENLNYLETDIPNNKNNLFLNSQQDKDKSNQETINNLNNINFNIKAINWNSTNQIRESFTNNVISNAIKNIEPILLKNSTKKLNSSSTNENNNIRTIHLESNSNSLDSVSINE